jgi:hypothetical protein
MNRQLRPCQTGNRERGRPARSVWRPAKHILPRLFSVPCAKPFLPVQAVVKSRHLRAARTSTEDGTSASPCPSVPVYECPCQPVKPIPAGKPAEKAMQMFYHKVLTNCSRSNQVTPSQSESNQLHGFDQSPKSPSESHRVAVSRGDKLVGPTFPNAFVAQPCNEKVPAIFTFPQPIFLPMLLSIVF